MGYFGKLQKFSFSEQKLKSSKTLLQKMPDKREIYCQCRLKALTKVLMCALARLSPANGLYVVHHIAARSDLARGNISQ